MGTHSVLFDIPGMMHKGENAIRIVGVMRDTNHAKIHIKRNHESGFRIFSIEPLMTSKAYETAKRAPSARASWSFFFFTVGAFLRPLVERLLDAVGGVANMVLAWARRFLRWKTVLAVWEPPVLEVVTSN